MRSHNETLELMRQSYSNAERLFRKAYSHIDPVRLDAVIEANRDSVRLVQKIRNLERQVEKLQCKLNAVE